jgi:hypothetical protein
LTFSNFFENLIYESELVLSFSSGEPWSSTPRIALIATGGLFIVSDNHPTLVYTLSKTLNEKKQ